MIKIKNGDLMEDLREASIEKIEDYKIEASNIL